MKLKNKLLPLVGIGAACAAVTPIALTSCNKSSGLVDLTQKYQSKYTEVPEHATWKIADAYDRFFGFAANEIDLVADEIYWSQSGINVNFFPKTGDNEMQVVTDNELVSNISLKKVDNPFEEGETSYDDYEHFWTISYDREVNYEFKYSISLPGTSSYYDIALAGKMSVKNLPILLTYDSSTSFWSVYTEDELLYYAMNDDYVEDFQTSITVDVNYKVTIPTESIAGTIYQTKDYFYDHTINDSETLSTWENWVQLEQDKGSGPLTYLYGGATFLTQFYLLHQWYSHYLFNILGE